MQNGIDFENLVDAITRNRADPKDKWYDAAAIVADKVRWGYPQYRARKNICAGGLDLVLYGRIDWLKAGDIIDVKFTKNYDPGKYFDSTQHPVYFELIPEARNFTYLVSNGSSVWPETYTREETRSIFPIIEDFFEWLNTMGLMELYKEKWLAK